MGRSGGAPREPEGRMDPARERQQVLRRQPGPVGRHLGDSRRARRRSSPGRRGPASRRCSACLTAPSGPTRGASSSLGATSASCGARRCPTCDATSASSFKTSSCSVIAARSTTWRWRSRCSGSTSGQCGRGPRRRSTRWGSAVAAASWQRACRAASSASPSPAPSPGEPAILVADEPTGNLDPLRALEVLERFEALRHRGTTMIVATHDPDIVRFGVAHGWRRVRLEAGVHVEGLPDGLFSPSRRRAPRRERPRRARRRGDSHRHRGRSRRHGRGAALRGARRRRGPVRPVTGVTHAVTRSAVAIALRRALVAGLRSAARTPLVQLVAVGTIALSLLLVGVVRLAEDNVGRLVAGWTRGAQMVVYLDETVAPARAHQIADVLVRLPSVAGVHVVDGGEAFGRLRASLGDRARLLDGVDATMLPSVD